MVEIGILVIFIRKFFLLALGQTDQVIRKAFERERIFLFFFAYNDLVRCILQNLRILVFFRVLTALIFAKTIALFSFAVDLFCSGILAL